MQGEKGSANWLIPIHEATERYISENAGKEGVRDTGGNHIHTEYLVMERMV